jgi:hypothetical protein
MSLYDRKKSSRFVLSYQARPATLTTKATARAAPEARPQQPFAFSPVDRPPYLHANLLTAPMFSGYSFYTISHLSPYNGIKI